MRNYESVQHRLQFSGIKKGDKISFNTYNINTCVLVLILILILAYSSSLFDFSHIN